MLVAILRYLRGIGMIFDRLQKKIRNIGNTRKYVKGDKESISISNINIDVRHPDTFKGGVIMGRESYLNGSVCFETNTGSLIIGNNTYLGGVSIITKDEVRIDDNVQIAWNVLIYDHNAHSFNYLERQKDMKVFWDNAKRGFDALGNHGKNWDVVYSAPIHICSNSWIGTNVIILSGVTIGEGAIIGAGSVVRDSIPAWAIAYGNPCKVVSYNKYHE